MKEDGLAAISASTAGRMINDLKKQGIIPQKTKLSLYGRTGRLIERKPKKIKKKLRSKGHIWRSGQGGRDSQIYKRNQTICRDGHTRRPHWPLGLVSPLRYIVSKLSDKESYVCWTDTMC